MKKKTYLKLFLKYIEDEQKSFDKNCACYVDL